jgi:hypothetical protein
LKGRGHTPEQMQTRLNSQFNFDQKRESLEETIKEDNHGKIWVLENSNGQDNIESTFDLVVKDFKIK